uniref:hypothetical protein n=1 Tax=Cecembia rubra TaxID=1485585 RepID=UPI002714CBE7
EESPKLLEILHSFLAQNDGYSYLSMAAELAESKHLLFIGDPSFVRVTVVYVILNRSLRR